MKRSKMMHKLAAAATAGMMVGSSADAFASGATTFKDMTSNIATASSGFNNMISMVAWIAGAGLGVAGIFKLKQHVDNPGQTPMKDGLIRLGAGGGLLSLPFFMSAMQGSISDTDAAAKPNASDLLVDDTTVFQ